jgi:hypothetical protein
MLQEYEWSRRHRWRALQEQCPPQPLQRCRR